MEFRSKALILSRRVGSLYRREVKEGGRERVEELQGKVDKLEEEKAAWKKEKGGLGGREKKASNVEGSLFRLRGKIEQ